MDGLSQTPEQDKINALRQILPEAFSEGKIDWEKLKATLGENVNFSNERYVLNWAGKSDAFKVLQTPTTKTLIPDKEKSINFDETENIFIEGENLEVLKVLQKSYFGKVKMISIDPPYNTGNDSFIYPDKFSETKAEYEKRVGDKDEEGYMTKDGMFKKNSKENGQYHSNWLNMMMPRLYLAKNLLKQEGVILVSIDDYEVHNLRLMMNEIFGEENFICQLIWNKQHSQQQGLFKKYHEYILLYAKNETLHTNISGGDGIIDAGALKKVSRGNPESTFTFPVGVRFEAPEGTKIEGTFGDAEKVTVVDGALICENGKTKESVTLSAGWTQKDQMTQYFLGKEVLDTKGQKVVEFYFNSKGKLKCLKERSKITPSTILPEYGMVSSQTAYVASLFGNTPVFDNPKPIKMIIDFIDWFCEENDIVLDFFGGSGTLGEAALQSKSKPKFIVVQLDEKIDDSSESGKNAIKLGFNTISELSASRISRAIQKIKADNSLFQESNDLGFKLLKLKDSNFKQWQQIDGKDAIALAEQMKLFVDPVSESATIENMVYELLLKSGKNINSKIEKKQNYFSINENELVLILEKASQEIIDEVIGSKPNKVIALDKLFKGNDQLKTNTVLQMKDASIEFKTI
ncbi:MAG: site-specific DNA-methyltransferase [Sediminibacterium sp.]|nr:MAG: site-specific DNA-methyltransferase [Sediminibacterium sp.] [Sediminibacterium sp. FEMGT703S]